MSEYRAKFGLEVADINDLEAYAGNGSRVHLQNHQEDNNARASFGATAFVAYVKRVGEDEFATSMADLLSDLMHLCDALGIDWEEAELRARRYNQDETAGVL